MRRLSLASLLAFGTLPLAALALGGCDGQHGGATLPGANLKILSGDMKPIPADAAGKTCGGLKLGQKVKLRLDSVVSDLGAASLTPDTDSSMDDEDGGNSVDAPTVSVPQPTRIDFKLKQAWFSSTPGSTPPNHDQYVDVAIKLLKSDATGPKNPNVQFLTKPGEKPDNSSWAVESGSENADMFCWRSDILSPKPNKKGQSFSVVHLHIKAGSVKDAIGSLNIGLLIGPDAKMKYIPIYIDPKVHNDGNP